TSPPPRPAPAALPPHPPHVSATNGPPSQGVASTAGHATPNVPGLTQSTKAFIIALSTIGLLVLGVIAMVLSGDSSERASAMQARAAAIEARRAWQKVAADLPEKMHPFEATYSVEPTWQAAEASLAARLYYP